MIMITVKKFLFKFNNKSLKERLWALFKCI